MVLILSFVLQPERPRENGKERTEAIFYEPDADVTPRSEASLSPFRSARTRTVLTHFCFIHSIDEEQFEKNVCWLFGL